MVLQKLRVSKLNIFEPGIKYLAEVCNNMPNKQVKTKSREFPENSKRSQRRLQQEKIDDQSSVTGTKRSRRSTETYASPEGLSLAFFALRSRSGSLRGRSFTAFFFFSLGTAKYKIHSIYL